MLKGSTDSSKKDFTTISVASGITLEGWSGVFINHDNGKAHGILVNMNGKIHSIDDINNSPGVGIYVNGNIQHKENAPIINLSRTANITSTGNGIYSAGYATYNINGAYIEGKESGIGIKSGVFNILDGTIIGSGEDKTPTSGNNNGINPSGSAIQIESNQNYEGDIELTIKKGTIKSNHSNVIYEYSVNNNPTSVKKISLSGGTYLSKSGKNVFSLSDSFKNTHQKFISGGTYSSDPTQYVKSGFNVSKEDANYEVIQSTMRILSPNDKKDNNSVMVIAIISFLVILGILIYLNRNKLIYVIKK